MKIQDHYIKERINKLDPDYLEFEELNLLPNDKQLIETLLQTKDFKLPNPHNSIILYATGLSDDFDFNRRRSDLTGGSPPDIDMDFDALDRQKVFEWIVQNFGREHIANILTHGTFKPKSTVKDYFRVISTPETEAENLKLQNEILAMIPDALFGKEPSLHEAIYGNKEKGYLPHPDLLKEKYKPWLETALRLENMVKSFGIHAAGIVISNEPIYEHIPIWWKDDEELQPNGSKKKIEKYITQYNMGEVEALGLIKMDILSIDNISILKEACRLVKERHGIDIDPYTIEDGDPKAYKLLEQGLMSGVFQLEGSASVKDLTQRIAPHSIDELSDINALHRPGPLSAGLHETYIQNKNNGYAPDDLPDIVADILKETKWTLIYQETVMNLVSKLAGFSLKEADDVRRAMG